MELSSGELLSLLFLSFALGMDAFSICLGLGMQKLRLKRIMWISLTIGFFHMLMPLLGIIIGKMIAGPLESYAQLVSGLLLLFIGAQMFFGAFKEEKKLLLPPVGIGLFILAFSVSADSFTVGLGLGLSDMHVILAFLLFGIASTVLSCFALMIGRSVQGFLGSYSELLGGSVLSGFGIYFLFI